MAERTRSEKRQRRSDARTERRSLAAKPFEELDETAGAEERGGGSHSTLRQAATTALAGALVAGVAGAAKALADRRGDQPAPERDTDGEPTEAAGAEPQAEVQDERPEGAEQDDAQAQDAPPEHDDEQDEQPQDSTEVELETQPNTQEDEPQASDEGADGPRDAPRGASNDDVKEIVDTAKRELQELLGVEVESVSGFHRSDDHWKVTLEVVNVHRIPDTTDVLSSYEVALDDDRNLVSISETRRYRRSQVEEG